MKLSPDTMNILKNFTGINESIFVKPGNVLETISKKKNILARAEVAESFPTSAAVRSVWCRNHRTPPRAPAAHPRPWRGP